MKINREFKTNKLWESLVGVLAFLMFLFPVGYVSALLGKSTISYFITGVSTLIIIVLLRYFFPGEYSLKIMYWPTAIFVVITDLFLGFFNYINFLFPDPWFIEITIELLASIAFVVFIVWLFASIEKMLVARTK